MPPVPTITLAAAATEGAPPNPEAFGIGSLALVLAATAVLGWLAFLYVNSRRRRSAELEEPPENLSPYLSDDELENRRSTIVLRNAVVAGALLSILMVWYAAQEPARQVAFAEAQHEEAVERGAKLYERFGCAGCHGPTGSGGGAEFSEARSGVDVTWYVPSLDDVFYRFSVDEVRFWIEYGRPGTPMPANGLEGGGAMTFQEIDEVIAFLQSIQIPQSEAVARREGAVASALQRIDEGDRITAELLALQRAAVAEVEAAPDRLGVVGDFDTRARELLGGPGTCTAESGALVGRVCEEPGSDTDRDGLTDAVEAELSEMARIARETLLVLDKEKTKKQLEAVFVPNTNYDVAFDATSSHTNEAKDGTPIPDLDAAETLLQHLDTDLLLLRVAAERQEAFLADLLPGLEFLEEAAAARPWQVDFDAIAAAMTERQAADARYLESQGVEDAPAPRTFTADEAREAAGLYNAYCARCHTGGWSAGPPFEQGPGSGAWGPALRQGRSVVQFPDWRDQVEFVIGGTDQAVHYGVNGLGSGRMPGFGMLLSEEDIEMIVMFERSL